jgi:ribosomal protein L29
MKKAAKKSTENNKKSIFDEISSKKRELLLMKVKLTSGDSVPLKDLRKNKKEVARLFTKLNDPANA